MEEKKTWWQRRGWIALGGGVILLLIISAVSSSPNNSSSPVPATTKIAEPQASTPRTPPVIGNDGKPLVDDTNNPLMFATSSIQELMSNAGSPAFENNIPDSSGASSVSLTTKIVKVLSSKNGDFLISDGSNYAIVLDTPTDPNTGNPSPAFQAFSANVGKTVILYGLFTGGTKDSASGFQKLSGVKIMPSTPVIVGLAAYPLVGRPPVSSVTTQNATVHPSPTPIPKKEAVSNTVAPQESAPQTSNTGTQVPPRDSNGLIHQLNVKASVQFRSIAFTSQENYTNCSDSLTVITVDSNQQPVFATYKDSGSINLFAGDEHSIAYGSLTNNNGGTLAADILSGKFGNNAAGNWGLTCNQGEYSLKIDTIN